MRIFQGGRRGLRPGLLKEEDGLPGPVGWEKSAESESSDIIMSTSSSSALKACGLPGSESMEDWSSLSYLACWGW